MKTALLACMALATAALVVAQDVPLSGYRPFIEAEPADPTCAVQASVYLTEQTFDALALSKPTASPVPTTVLGDIVFDITNYLPTAIEPRWTLGVQLPAGARFTELTNALRGNVTYGSNNTQTIELIAAYEDQVLEPDARNAIRFGADINATSQAFTPQAVFLQGRQCLFTLTVNVTNETPFIPIDTSQLIESAPQPISIDGINLIGTDGEVVTLKGANWFGFEQPATMLDGLFEGDVTITGDYAAVLYRLQLLGFNAVRVPFSFQVLFNTQPVSYTRTCTNSTADDFESNVTPPGVNVAAGASLPVIPARPASYGEGQCNGDLPNDSVYTRFLYTVRYLAANNFYVVLDNQLNTDPTCPMDATMWVKLWSQVLTDVISDGVTGNRVILDILNEPDAANFLWEAGNGLPGMTANYLAAMDALNKISPSTLFMVEGLAQQGLGVCWGDGFSVDQDQISQFTGAQSAQSFLDELVGRPYVGNVIIAPHYYGPSISKNTARFSGTDLVKRATTTFGYLNFGKGYCRADGVCHAFPIVIGETGSRLTNPDDTAFYDTLTLYLQNTGIGNDGAHNAIPHLFWWAWNANAGDTGGIVDDTWLQIEWTKVTLLEKIIGLTPWALNPSGTTATPVSPSSPSPAAPAAQSPPSPSPAAPVTPESPPSPSPAAPVTPQSPPSPSPAAPVTPQSPPSPSPAAPVTPQTPPSPASPSPQSSPSPSPESPSPSSPSPTSPTNSPSPSSPSPSSPTDSPSPSPSPSSPSPASPTNSPSPSSPSPSSPDVSPSSPANNNPPSPGSGSQNFNPPSPSSGSQSFNPPTPNAGPQNFNPPSPVLTESAPASLNPPSPPSPPEQASPSTSPSPSSPDTDPFASPSPASSTSPSSSSSPSTSPSPSNSPVFAPLAPASQSPTTPAPPCTVSVGMGATPWTMGDQYVNNVNLYLQATGPKAIVPPYTVVATAAAYGNVTGFWNWEVSSSTGGNITGLCSLQWQLLSPKRSNNMNVGFNVVGPKNGAAYRPSHVSINGTSCTLVH